MLPYVAYIRILWVMDVQPPHHAIHWYWSIAIPLRIDPIPANFAAQNHGMYQEPYDLGFAQKNSEYTQKYHRIHRIMIFNHRFFFSRMVLLHFLIDPNTSNMSRHAGQRPGTSSPLVVFRVYPKSSWRAHNQPQHVVFILYNQSYTYLAGSCRFLLFHFVCLSYVCIYIYTYIRIYIYSIYIYICIYTYVYIYIYIYMYIYICIHIYIYTHSDPDQNRNTLRHWSLPSLPIQGFPSRPRFPPTGHHRRRDS